MPRRIQENTITRTSMITRYASSCVSFSFHFDLVLLNFFNSVRKEPAYIKQLVLPHFSSCTNVETGFSQRVLSFCYSYYCVSTHRRTVALMASTGTNPNSLAGITSRARWRSDAILNKCTPNFRQFCPSFAFNRPIFRNTEPDKVLSFFPDSRWIRGIDSSNCPLFQFMPTIL